MIEVVTCQSSSEVQQHLSGQARVIAGGTLLMRDINYGSQTFDRLVRVADPALSRIDMRSSAITLGSAVTLDQILVQRELAFLHPVARRIGGPALRSMGTVGGNLFAETPYGDLTTALLALGATVTWADGQSEGMEAFLSGRHTPRGLVVSVSFTAPHSVEFGYLKVSRTKPKGPATLSIAAFLKRDAGRLGDVRIAIGSFERQPVRSKGAEAALRGASLDETTLRAAALRAAEGLTPVEDGLASAWYRREVLPVHISRLLLTQGQSS